MMAHLNSTRVRAPDFSAIQPGHHSTPPGVTTMTDSAQSPNRDGTAPMLPGRKAGHLVDLRYKLNLAAWNAHVNLSLGRNPDPRWKRRPGRPRCRWIDQIRKDSNDTPPADLWRREIGRGHGASLRPKPATR